MGAEKGSVGSTQPETSVPLVLRGEDAGIVTLTMNRPERMNPLSSQMLAALQVEIDRLASDGDARVVVLAGAGAHFSAGHDLREMQAHPDKAWQLELFRRCGRLMTSLVALPQPVIARVQGSAVAAGCELVSTCDLAVASESASFALPGIKSGIFCTTPGVPVARNLARKHALDLLLTGRSIDAATALGWGLVNRVVTAATLGDEVQSLARTIAAYSPAVVRMGKRLFYEQVEKNLLSAYALAGAGMADNMMLDDAAEGIDAFLSKRQPKWTGK